jgi:hypothetical protein
MAKIIGQHLFRLLFGTSDFRNYLHLALEQDKGLEIILEFDQSKDDSKRIMNLPWELMYCPERMTGPDNDIKQDGFFVSQTANIYRKYREATDNEPDEKREVWVAVAFLTKDMENLSEIYEKFRVLAEAASRKNQNLHFDFINYSKEHDILNFLSKEDLGRIFLSNKNSVGTPPVNKIVHLVCDTSIVTTGEDDYGNTLYEKALYFNKRLKETEPIGFTEVFKELFNKNILQDQYLRLLVLQAWNDEKNYTHSGFEEFANRVIRKKFRRFNIYALPVEPKKCGREISFFETLYDSLASSLSIKDVVKQIRNDIVPKFSYGFPLLYLNGRNEVLVHKENISRSMGDVNPVGINTEINEKRLKELDALEQLFLDKKAHFEKAQAINADPGKDFQLIKNIEEIDASLEKIAEERKRFSLLSMRLGK